MFLENPLFIGMANAIAGAVAAGLLAWPIGAATTKKQVAAALEAATVEPIDTEQVRLALNDLDELEQEAHYLFVLGDREGEGAGQLYEHLRLLNNRLLSLGIRTVRSVEEERVFELLGAAPSVERARRCKEVRAAMQAELGKTKGILCRLARDAARQREVIAAGDKCFG